MPNLLPFKWNIALTLVFTVVKFHSEPLYFSAANYVTRVEYTLDFMENQASFHLSNSRNELLTSDDTLDCVSSLHFCKFLFS